MAKKRPGLRSESERIPGIALHGEVGFVRAEVLNYLDIASGVLSPCMAPEVSMKSF